VPGVFNTINGSKDFRFLFFCLQKNPSTVRHPEESRPTETFDLDLLMNVGASHVVSSHISEMCKDASALTYTRDVDLHQLSQSE